MPKVIVVTGTDTGVGKTLFTGLLLTHLRNRGYHALAMKLFASGGTADADLLDRLQNNELPRTLLNPFLYREPLAPLVAARRQHKKVELADAIEKITAASNKCELLVVEGCGGLMTPLGENFDLLDIIKSVPAIVVVVARNRLGVLNQTLLTHSAILGQGFKIAAIVLMGIARPDKSVETNLAIISERKLADLVIEIPYLGRVQNRASTVKKLADQLRRKLSKFEKLVLSAS